MARRRPPIHVCTIVMCCILDLIAHGTTQSTVDQTVKNSIPRTGGREKRPNSEEYKGNVISYTAEHYEYKLPGYSYSQHYTYPSYEYRDGYGYHSHIPGYRYIYHTEHPGYHSGHGRSYGGQGNHARSMQVAGSYGHNYGQDHNPSNYGGSGAYSGYGRQYDFDDEYAGSGYGHMGHMLMGHPGYGMNQHGGGYGNNNYGGGGRHNGYRNGGGYKRGYNRGYGSEHQYGYSNYMPYGYHYSNGYEYK